MDEQNLRLRIRITQEGTLILGPGRADLLDFIHSTGSIAAAGREMGMSYKRAWVLVEAMNKTFASPLVEAVKGGPGGGGARLTSLGQEVLEAYKTLVAYCDSATAGTIAKLQSQLAVSLKVKSR